MKRIPLPVGAQIQSESLCFTIDSVLGHGANCIVYNAHYDDRSKHCKEVIIKECYPVRASVSRQEHTLSWDSADEMQSAFDRMQRSYDLASEMQDSDVTRSASVYTLDKISANGTQYIIMIPQHGHSYDKDKSTDIANIIRTVLALCNAVGLYHQAGYLHLDIKPSNFIATTDHTGKGKNIALFDLDTLVALDDIQSALVAGVSYTKEWAAPEQKQMQIAKLCPATDLYAIGAILFERIMHRMPTNADMSPFATWEYDDRFNAKKVNPKAKRLLTDIFHKTLSANVKRRYQSASDLAEVLGELLEVVCCKEPYIIPTLPIGRCKFVGRSKETNELRKALEVKQKVFISGLGGIGKSEFVKHYIDAYNYEYDAVVFLTYKGSVETALSSIQISRVTNLGDKKDVLPQLCDERVLIVLDNYDVAIDEDNTLNQLLQLNCNIIITTRTNFSTAYTEFAHITLHGLSKENLRTIFENESQTSLSDKDYLLLNPVLHYGYQCTFYWCLLAAAYKSGAYDLKDLVQKALEGLNELNETEDVFSNKDGIRTKQTIAEAIFNLVKLDQLSEAEVDVLIILYFIDFLSLSKKQIREVFGYDSSSVVKRMNALNSLIEKRYIVEYSTGDGIGYKLSDVISDTVCYKFNPKIEDYSAVTEFIDKKFYTSKNKLTLIDWDQHASQMHARYLFARIFSMYYSLQPSNRENEIYFIDLIFRMIGGYEFLWNFAHTRYTMKFINSLIVSRKSDRIDELTKAKIFILLISFYSNGSRTDFLEEIKEEEIISGKKMILYFREAILLPSNIINKKEIHNELCMPIVACAEQTQRCRLLEPDIIDRVFEMNPDCIHNAKPLSSFGVKVFRNPEYEEYYLQKVLDNPNNESDQKLNEKLSDALMKVFYNGVCVSQKVSNKLRKLRRRAYNLCEEVLIGENGLLTKDEYPPISRVGYMAFCRSISIIPKLDEITPKQDARSVEQETSSVFIESEPDQNEALAESVIGKVRNYESEVYEALERFKERKISGKDPYEEDLSYLVDLYEEICGELEQEEVANAFPYCGEIIPEPLINIKMDFCSASVILFAILGDNETLTEKINELLSLTRENLNETGYYVIVDKSYDFESYSDVPLIRTFNVLSDNGFSDEIYSFVINYVVEIEEIFDIRETLKSMENGELDSFEESDELQAIIPYYDLLIEVTERAIRSLEANQRLLFAIFDEKDEKLSEHIEQLKVLVEVYRLRLKKASGMEYL